MLQALIPEPHLAETVHVDVAVLPWQAYQIIRHFDAGVSPLIRGLFGLRNLPEKLTGQHPAEISLKIDDLFTRSQPGFRILADTPDVGFAVGAIAQLWNSQMVFAEVDPSTDFAHFDEPGWAKIAWAVGFHARGTGTRIVFELRVTTTDESTWPLMEKSYHLIGPISHLLRHHLLQLWQTELGNPVQAEQTRMMPGDELLPDALGQSTHGITFTARPEQIWPWLIQMGCRRAGWYSQDWIDNGRVSSAEQILPQFQALGVGEILPATPDGTEGFEVLRIEAPNLLLLGSCYDLTSASQIPFAAPLPEKYWRATWCFETEALSEQETRLHVRARIAFSPGAAGFRLSWLRPVHALMQTTQLHHLKRRVEASLAPQPPQDSPADIAAGLAGAGRMLVGLLTPFLMPARSHWGLSPELAAREYPGDELVPAPDWGWTHGIEIAAPAASVWPWVVQIGQNKGGFYSYQWLENLAGCQIQNADQIKADWQSLQLGDGLSLHPDMPPFKVVQLKPGESFVVYAALDPQTGEPPTQLEADSFAVSWLFYLESLSSGHSRLISRFRCHLGPGLAAHLAFGPWLIGSIGFVMDRKMLRSIREKSELQADAEKDSQRSSPGI